MPIVSVFSNLLITKVPRSTVHMVASAVKVKVTLGDFFVPPMMRSFTISTLAPLPGQLLTGEVLNQNMLKGRGTDGRIARTVLKLTPC